MIACVALFFSLAGTGIAAQHYLITSLSQIKPSIRHQLRGKRGPRGRIGPRGQQGPQGIQGEPGTFSVTDTSFFAAASATLCPVTTSPPAPCTGSVSIARCPPREVALGGGWDSSAGYSDTPNVTIIRSTVMQDGGAWMVQAVNQSSTQPYTFWAVVICGGQSY